ncbi:MAG: hypothetical protein RLZZ292_712 [Bacteroidota bacterium]|jgi:hypothetical protein
MNERKFDHLFLDGLNQNPSTEYNPQVWTTVAARLEQDKRRKKLLGFLLLAIPLLFLLGGNVWTWNALQNTRQALADMQQLVAQQTKNTINSDTTLSKATHHEVSNINTQSLIIRRKEVVYHYDTIYRTVYVREKSAFNQAELDSYVSQWIKNNNYISNNKNTNSLTPNTSTTTIVVEDKIKEKLPNFEIKNTKNKNATDFLPSLPLTLLGTEKDLLEIVTFEYNRSFPILKKENLLTTALVTLKEYKPLGRTASLGIGVPRTIEKLNLTQNLNFQVEYDWQLSNHFLAGLGLNYQKMNLKTLVYRADWGIPAPIYPIGGDYVIKYIEGNFKNIQPTLKLKYNFTSNKTINPYLGVGYGVQKRLPSEIEYEFINASNMERPATQNAVFKKIIWNVAQFNTGINYRLSDDWSANLDLIYQTQLGTNKQIINTFNTAFVLKKKLGKK